MKKSLITYFPVFMLLFITSLHAAAQKDSTKLKQEVEVVKAYQPSISDAFKINDIPKVQDEKREKPNFSYQINSQPVFSSFELEPVQAAQMIGAPKQKLGKGLLKAGVGNYNTPYAEIFYNTTTGKNSNFGLHFKHLSSNGKVKLINDDKVDAPQSENIAELFSNHFFRKSTLSTKLFFNREAHRYYGYTGEMLTDSVKEKLMPYWNDKQAFSKGGIQLRLTNDENSPAKLNYDLNLYYHYFGSKTGQTENLATDSIFNETSNDFGQKKQIMIKLCPAILLEADVAKLQVGLNTFTLLDDDDDARILVTPNLKAAWSPVKNIMSLFVIADGRLQQNHYSAIAAENRFVNPNQDIKNTEYQYILSGGIKGKFSQQFNYRFQADYANIKDQHFFVTNTTSTIEADEITRSSTNNTFDVLYDDLKQLTLGAELYYTASDLVIFHMKGNYYSYQLDSLEQPWLKPEFDATISAIINPEGPLKFNADVFFIGERKALIQNKIYNPSINSPGPHQVDKTIYTLQSVIDLNFGMEYQYSPQLSFFGRLNNFAFQKYENWPGYSQQSFNVLLGVSYSF